MSETIFSRMFVDWVAILGSIFTTIALFIVIIQVCDSMKKKKEFGAILSAILRHADTIKSQAISCSNAGAADKESMLASIGTSAAAIRIGIEEFARHHWKQELPGSPNSATKS
jgi:hypothetical protein